MERDKGKGARDKGGRNRLSSASFSLFPFPLPLLTIALFCISFSASPQPYRNNLSHSPQEIYKSLLTFAQAQEFDKVKSYALFLTPVTQAFKEKYKVDIEKELVFALNKKDRVAVEKVLQALIYLDIKDLISVALEGGEENFDIEQAKAKMQAAYLSYLLLSPFIQGNHFASDQGIKRKFRTIVLTLVRATPYKGEVLDPALKKAYWSMINQWMTEMDKELKLALGRP
ncbi:MAG: hypothetical protein HY559_00595 [Gammaproteobacteria bacterium]|nr:hypothetical protein [Gammaproteobacteria bacterium]